MATRRLTKLDDFSVLKNRSSVVGLVARQRYFDRLVGRITLEGSDLDANSEAIRKKFPTLTTAVVRQISKAVQFAASNSQLSVSAIADLLSATGVIVWDLRSQDMQWQTNGAPITANGQNVGRVRPFSGTVDLVADTAAPSFPLSHTETGVNFPNTGSAFDFIAQSLKSVFFVCQPKIGNPSDITYPFLLGSSGAYDFHGGATSFFDETYTNTGILNGQLRLNGATVTASQAVISDGDIALLSIVSATNLIASSVAKDRGFAYTAGLYRTYYGNYRLIILSSTVYTLEQTIALEKFCLSYSGLA